MMKKLLCVTIAALLIFSIAACTKTEELTQETKTLAEKESTDSVQATEETQDTKTEEAAMEIAGKVTIFFPEITTWPGYMPAMEQFEAAYPSIELDFSSVKNDQYMSSLWTRVAANDIPDVFMAYYGTPYYGSFINKDMLMDITNESFTDRLTDVGKSVVEVNGKIYGIPMNSQVIGTLYNKDIYTELGLTPPTTWEEFLANCETIKNADMTPIALGIKDAFVVQMLPYTIWPTVLYGENPDFEQQRIEGTVKYNSPEWKKALEMNFEVFDKGYTNTGALGVSYDQSLEMFATGQAVMLHMGDWCVDSIKTINPDINAGFFLTPAPEGYKQAVPSQPGGAFVIYKDTEYPEASKKYVEAMATDPEYYYQWNKSPLQPFKDAPEVEDPLYKEFAVAYNSTDIAYGFVASNWINSSLQDVFMRGMQDVYAGQKTITELAEEMDEQFEKILPEYLKGLEE